jgi:hypothetical protein
MVPTAFEYQRGILVAPYISSMSHNNGGVTNIGEIFVSKSEKSPLDDDEGGVVGVNCTFHLVKTISNGVPIL